MKVTQPTSNQVQGSEAQAAKRSGKAGATDATKDSKKSDGTAATSAGGESTRTDISLKAKELASAKAAASKAPDVREERVAELKRKIAEGKYNVDAKAVADKMVDSHLNSGIS